MAQGITKYRRALDEEMEQILLDEADEIERDGSTDRDQYLEEPTDKTLFWCESCGDRLLLQEDIVLLQVAQIYLQDDLEYRLVLEEGEPIVRPLYFHVHCFEIVEGEVAEQVTDDLPVEEHHAVITCDYCRSSIRMGENTTTATDGQICESKRLVGTTTFVPWRGRREEPALFCLVCTAHLADAVGCGEWTGLTQKGECDLCTKARCWRAGKCTCLCHSTEQNNHGAYLCWKYLDRTE